MTEYFSMRDFLLNKFDESYRSLGFNGKTRQELEAWQTDTRKELCRLLGMDKLHGGLKKVDIVEDYDFPSYDRQKIIVSVLDNTSMPVYVLKPKSGNKRPVIALHGHGSDGKNTLAGIVNEKIKDKYERFNYTYAQRLAEMGFTVYIPDLCGSGERREKKQRDDDGIDKSSCTDLNYALISLGLSLQAVIVTELIGLADYIVHEHNTDKIGCVGFSGGGLAALWLSALDDRIDLAVVSGYFHGFRDTILENNLCGCNFVPMLWNKIDCGDFAALTAPRRIAVEIGDKDGLSGKNLLKNVYPQVDIAKRAYNLCGKDENFSLFVCDGSHKWFGECYSVIKAWGDDND